MSADIRFLRLFYDAVVLIFFSLSTFKLLIVGRHDTNIAKEEGKNTSDRTRLHRFVIEQLFFGRFSMIIHILLRTHSVFYYLLCYVELTFLLNYTSNISTPICGISYVVNWVGIIKFSVNQVVKHQSSQ